MSKVEIKGLKSKLSQRIESWNRKIHRNIPQLPFFVGIVGPRHRGKTVLLHNLLDKNLYGKLFKKENIVLYSPTYHWDNTLHDLELKHTFTNNDSVEAIVSSMKQQQEEYKAVNNDSPVLLVMDDITNIKSAFTTLEDLGYTGRHFNIHVIYVAHKFSSINRGLRTQTQQWILFEPHEQSEWDYILEMFVRRGSKSTSIWTSALRRAWDIPYNFVYIDFEEKEYDKVYRSGFNEPLFTDDEVAVLKNYKSVDSLEKQSFQNES